MPRRLFSGVALVMLLAAADATAETFARHVGQQDPTAEGWTVAGGGTGVSFGPVAPDADDIASWFVNDSSTASGSTRSYSTAPASAADLGLGWTLRSVLRVFALNDANDFSIYLEMSDGSRRLLLSFGSTSAGDATVRMGSDTATAVTPTPGTTAYHLYELAWDPVAGQADLFVDGQLALTGYVGTGTSFDWLRFGGGQSSSTGHGRYALVELLTGKQACRDGIDNDGDGLVDFAGGDPDCENPRDPHEESALDTDFDGVSDADEALAGSDYLLPDSDGDGLGDRFEIDSGFDPSVSGEQTGDPDGDGLDNSAEQAAGSDPNLADTDGDGLSDADEVNLYGSDPAASDGDGDGLSDFDEVSLHGTDPGAADTDGDGLPDGAELAAGTDPTLSDTDLDGLNDGSEANEAGTDPFDPDSDDDGVDDGPELLVHGTDPLDADSDDDGLTDGFEIAAGFDPLTGGEEGLDPDADSLTNLAEQANGSDPQLFDTDGDGLGDGDEVNLHATLPATADSDGDGLSDGFEVANALDPLDPLDGLADPDVDGLTNLAEAQAGTDPNQADTDADGVPDGDEVNILGSDPLDPSSRGVQVGSSDALLFQAADQPLFASLDDQPIRFDLVSDGSSGQQGQIVSVDQQLPLSVVVAAWEQAVATCDVTTFSVGTTNFCTNVSGTPTPNQCISGSVDISGYTVTCCNDFGSISNGCGFLGSSTYTISQLNALPGGPYVSTTYDLPFAVGPEPTEPPPPEPFDVGARVTHDISVAGYIDLDIEAVDGGLVDVAYHTQASLRADASTVAEGNSFVLEAVHRPSEALSSMSSQWPAASIVLDYEFDIDAFVELEYASLDYATGQQLHQTVTALDEHVVETGELFGLRTGIFAGFEMRFMNGVAYAPPGYQDVAWEVPPPPPGTAIDFNFTVPPTCPTLILEPFCGGLPQAPLSIDVFAERWQIPELNSPASPDYNGGVVGLNTSTPVEPKRGAIEPDGALVNTMPGRFRPLTNFTNDNPLDVFFDDSTNLSSDTARAEIDIDGLVSLASSGVFLAGVNFSPSSYIGLSFDVLDSDAVFWTGYEETLQFRPNLVADVSFDKTVEVFDEGVGAFVVLPAGQAVTLAVQVEGGELPQELVDLGLPTRLEVRQPAGGVQVDVVYSFRQNLFDNETYEIFTAAWQNTFLEMSLGGLIFDVLDQAGFGFTFSAFRVTASAPPVLGTRQGSADPFVGVAGSDFPGSSFSILDLSLDGDADGLPDLLEGAGCTLAADADSDDDGLADGIEDRNRNGLVDAGETDPCLADSDGDGFQDGTELGLLSPTADPDGGGPLAGTDLSVFAPSPSPTTTSDPTDPASTPGLVSAQLPALSAQGQLLLAFGLGIGAAWLVRRRRS